MIDVVIPVHGGLRHVRSCLESLHRWTHVEHRLIVVDDASDTHTRESVIALVEDGWGPRGTVLINDRNQGFLRTANRGMLAGDAPVVILLNSDTLLAPDWTDGLLTALASAPDVGIVSPLSNNANLTRIAWPYGCDHLQLAAAVRRLSPRHYPDIRLATGFCLVAWRKVLEQLDFFDEHYGRGYFEEADLCLRAAAAGWRTIADDATYVHHHGWGSFGAEERSALMEHNAELFRERWGLDHRLLRRSILRRGHFTELERRIGVAMIGRAQPRPRRALPRSGMRNEAERARTSEQKQQRRTRVPTSTRYPLEAWERIARDASVQRPRDAADVLVLCDDLDVTPRTTDLLQLADGLRARDVTVNLATTGVFDTALFTDPCRLRPYVLSGPDELLTTVPAHRMVLAMSPATVFDALLLRERDGSRVATWFDDQAAEPVLGWPGDGWSTLLAPRLADAHLGASVPLPVPEGTDVHDVPVGVDAEVYAPRPLDKRPGRILVTHHRRGGVQGGEDVRRFVDLLRHEGIEVTIYGDDVVGVEAATEPLAPQTLEAELLRDHLAVVEISPLPGIDRLRLRAAACGTPVVLACPTMPSCPLEPGREAFGVPRGDVQRAAEVAVDIVRRPQEAAGRVEAALRRALGRPAWAEVDALATAIAAVNAGP